MSVVAFVLQLAAAGSAAERSMAPSSSSSVIGFITIATAAESGGCGKTSDLHAAMGNATVSVRISMKG
jgi:hypothetical protein